MSYWCDVFTIETLAPFVIIAAINSVMYVMPWNTWNQLLDVFLFMKTPRLKHEMIALSKSNDFFHNSTVSFSSTFHIKLPLANALHKNTQREEVPPIALGTALQYNLDFISR